MKQLAITILSALLRQLARLIIWRFRPGIVGVTGSVGKTSAKEAIYTVLKSSGRVRRSRGNYNNEIGVPLTIIGSLSGGRSLIGWLAVFLRAFSLLVRHDKEYPEIQAENSLEIAKFYHQTCLKSYIDLTGFCLDNIIQNV